MLYIRAIIKEHYPTLNYVKIWGLCIYIQIILTAQSFTFVLFFSLCLKDGNFSGMGLLIDFVLYVCFLFFFRGFI
jgi:hypothetical protein